MLRGGLPGPHAQLNRVRLMRLPVCALFALCAALAVADLQAGPAEDAGGLPEKLRKSVRRGKGGCGRALDGPDSVLENSWWFHRGAVWD